MVRALVLAVALVLAACSAPHASSCSPENCEGCCRDDACKPGTDVGACGLGGSSCDICVDTQVCGATSGRCEMPMVDAGPQLCAKVPSPCSDQAIQQLDLKTTVAPGLVTNTTDGGTFDSSIDATAGGVSPTQSFVYAAFTADGLVKVSVDDQSSLDSLDWDIAFRRFVIRINGGTSGPSCDAAAAYAASVTFDTAAAAPTTTFAGDATFTPPDQTDGGSCMFEADGSGLPSSPSTALDNPQASFYAYTTCVQMSGRVFAIKTRAGPTVKVEVTGYYLNDAAQQMCQAGTMPNVAGGHIRVRWAFLP